MDRLFEEVHSPSFKRLTDQRSKGIVMDDVAAATLDNDLPFLEIIS